MKFKCPSCDCKISADESQFGHRANCPRCGAAFVVPGEPHAPPPPEVTGEVVADRTGAGVGAGVGRMPAFGKAPPRRVSRIGPQERRTTGWAVGSLICGVLGLTCIGAILAVVFGHIARAKIKRDPRLKGGAMAVIGLVLGYLSIVVSGAASMVAGKAVYAMVTERATQTRNMRIGEDLAREAIAYAQANGGRFPDSIDELIRESPGAAEFRNCIVFGEDGKQKLAEFQWFAGQTLSDPPGTILIAAPWPAKGDRVVIYISGTGEILEEGEFQSRIFDYDFPTP